MVPLCPSWAARGERYTAKEDLVKRIWLSNCRQVGSNLALAAGFQQLGTPSA
jgi:hypothetical protein